MRIAQIMLGKGFGGAERSFVDLCRALSARGHEVLAICETRSKAARIIAEKPGVRSACVSVYGPWDFIARRRIARLLRDFAPEIAQMHLARAATIAGPAARSLNIPSLAKTHNYVNLKYYRAIDHLVATTRKQAAYLADHAVESSRCSIIPNFSSINIDTLADRPGNNEPEILRIVAIGRMVRKKGFDVLLEALAATRSSGYRFSLSIAGDGPESDNLSAQRDALSLAGQVNFLGWCDDIAPCLQAADIFVLPSRDEPFGIVCLEAMALLVPIIATTTDGPVEFLDNDTAVLIPSNDAQALCAALVEIASNYPLANERAQAALVKYQQCYSEDIIVERYLELYRSLLGTESAPQN